MRKRRVGVTAGSRQIVGSQETGSLQIDAEMAAPLELRTPMGTCGEGLQSECGWKHGDNGAEDKRRAESNPRREGRGRERGPGEERAEGAHEALPHTPPGGKPPETRAPFPSESSIQNGGNRSRVRKPRNNSAPLTDSLRSEKTTEMRERGAFGKTGGIPHRGGGARYARMRRCLKLRQGAKPPETTPAVFA
jgi:hypothetical protein